MKPFLTGLIALALPAVGVAAAASGSSSAPLQVEAAARFAALALECVHREYPNKIGHVMQSDADARPPRALTPAFYGCYDWHSSVHGHWLLARLAKSFPDAEFAAAARAALARSLTPANIAAEVEYLRGAGRASFERPYGLAWLLQLAAELRTWDDPQAREWAKALSPLEIESAQRIMAWLPKLNYPDPLGRTQPDCFRVRIDLGLGRGDRRRRHDPAARPSRPDLLREGSRLRAGVRALRRRLPVAVPRRGRLHAAGPGSRRVRDLAAGVPAGDPAGRQRGLVAAGRRHRPQRPEARAHRRPEPEPRLDARGHRERPAARGSVAVRRCSPLREPMPRLRCPP